MPKLYSKALETPNIQKAIKTILSHQGSKTPGPDGIHKYNVNENTALKQTKLRLRKYKKTRSKTVEIPKANGKTRTLTICNLYDRIAQQAVYQVIEPIVDQNMSKNSYGFRRGISAKVAASRVAACINGSRDNYTVEIDFTKCFDNIPLDKTLDMLRELGIKDGKLISTIKHLMYTTAEYQGVGLGQGTILGPILANCYLTKLDRYIDEILDQTKYRKTRTEKHKGHIKEWLAKHNRKPQGKYYRYADDSIIVCHTREEQLMIYETLKTYIECELDISINETKTQLNYNECHFLGFYFVKQDDRKRIGIYVSDIEGIKSKVKNFKFGTFEDTWHFIKWLIGIMQYYDIVNDMSTILSYICLRLMKRSNGKKTNLEREKGTCKYRYHYKGKILYIDPFEVRRSTKTSFKDYNQNSSWIKAREYIRQKDLPEDRYYEIYKWALWTKQRGKDPIANEPLKLNDMCVHHIQPQKKVDKDSIDNLILVNSETHKSIHSSQKNN